MATFLRSSLVFIFLLTFHFAYADDVHNVLSGKIAAAHAAGKSFPAYSLFHVITGEKHSSTLKQETNLVPDAVSITALYNQKPAAVAISLQDEKGKAYTLEMLQSHPTAPDFNPGTIDAGMRRQSGYTEGLHYQGSVRGFETSIASMSVFENGDVMILFANDQGNFIVGKVEDGSGNYIFYNDVDMIHRPDMPCGVSEKMDAIQKNAERNGMRTTTAKLCKKVQIYWEVANKIYLNKVTLVATQNYITGLFNQFQTMYANENIGVELKSMYVWVSADDYPTASSNVALDKFKAFWNSLNDKFDGNIAHLLTRDNTGNGGGNGGLAYVDVLCSRNYGYAYSDIYGTFQSVPTYSWDVEVITHETGHNFGSNHTHWCGWMTGAGSTCGSIDNCYTQETTTACTTCGSTYLNSAATTAWKGTVMSYCHLVARGIALANGFGPLPGALIRSKVNSNTCLKNTLNVTLTPSPICSNDGAISLALATNNLGTAPYTYSWSNNAQTQSLSNLSTTGNYTVTVTDSNGCSNSFSTSLTSQSDPGNGIAVAELMPICCGNTSRVLTLAASAPKAINTCETVCWLRTTVPVTNLKKAIDTAQSTDLFYSSNAASISTVTGATLAIQPPVTCVGPISWYYTPFVSRTQKVLDSISSTSTLNTSIFSGTTTTQIGAFISLPDQSALPGACSVVDTPSTSSLMVTVSGYTGRANLLTILVQASADSSIQYRLSAAAGNGVYSIPLSGFQINPLKGLRISAFDFNCSNTTTCTSSQVAVSATRIITYAAITKPVFDTTCHAGTSIRVDFSPNNCTNLAVSNTVINAETATIYPNPATHTATLRFSSNRAGSTGLRVTDILGKTVFSKEISYKSGNNQQAIDVRQWAKGVYFVIFSRNESSLVEKLKLVVE